MCCRDLEMEVETEPRMEAGMEVEKEVGVEMAMETCEMEVVMEAGKEVEAEGGEELAMEVGMEVATGKENEMEVEEKVVATETGKEAEMEVTMKVGKEAETEVEEEVAMEVGKGVEAEVVKEAEMEVQEEVAMEVGKGVEAEVGKEVEKEVAEEDIVEPSPPASPVAAPKKLRRLRKVKEMEINESDAVDEVGEVSEKSRGVDVTLGHRESAEEILKRFGKGGDAGNCEGGKKRKAVQSTIMAAVVDMAKQGKVVAVSEGEVRGSDNAVAEDGGLELQSQGEDIRSQEEGPAVRSEEMAPLSKKKRSNTVKRCSAHATGLTFESASLEGETERMDDIENATGIGGEIHKGNPDDSDIENSNAGNEDMEDDGGASDSETGNEGNEDEEEGGLGLNSGWSDGWAGEGMSMESILEKARKMVDELSKPAADSVKPSKEKKYSSEEALTGMDGQNGKKKKLSKKEEERIKREEVFAESQRLLRESKGVAFVAPAPVTKPVSSVLDKIRQRRLQLGCSGSGSVSSHVDEKKSVLRRATKQKSTTHVDLTVDDDTEVEIEMFSSNVVKIEEVKPEDVVVDVQVRHISTHGVSRDKEGLQIADGDGKAQGDVACDEKIPGTPEGQKDLSRDDVASSRSDEEDSKLESSQHILATQDLLCTSQLSPATQESVAPTPFESVVTTASDLMGFDTQLLDEELMPRSIRDDHHLQNKETGLRPPGQFEVYTKATHVRGLIDDEAEDEDEDILAENAEEEEILGDEDDLQDLIASTEKEKSGDKARRDALHRKWLEQQDTEQTEDILERLRTGRSTRWKGRDRVVSCLDEDEDIVNNIGSKSLDKISLGSQIEADGLFAEEDHTEEPLISLRQRARSQELETDCLLDEYEDVDDIAREDPVVEDEIIEDEEEHEQSIMRKRLLEESEEQLVFMSPAEDESSREVLSLINKVNVGNLKTKSTTGHLEIRGLGSTSLSSKPSFLGRSSSSSSLPPPAHRQVGAGGSSRSFVFGRDDSNSGHGFPPNQAQEEKNPVVAKSASVKRVSSTSASGGKKRSTPQATTGPSLFEMLKKQSEEHDQGQKTSTSTISKKWSSNSEAFSIFASKKSVTVSRRKL
ncbi:hypothetical protein M758_3G215500 [Ceratodon purpureus]|nr:hypothetical protein M758_3G215500 [Ceratodon purpureus]